MDNTIKRDVRHVIEEMDNAYYAFSEHNYTNGDYADFAGMALNQFQNALRDPNLTREQLESLLRDGIAKHRMGKSCKNWTRFVATHMAQAANA